MLKSVCPRLRTNLPCRSVAIKRTLTSSTRLRMVRIESSGSSGLEVGGAIEDPLATYAAGGTVLCAAAVSQAAPIIAAATQKTRAVYFIPMGGQNIPAERHPAALLSLWMHVTDRKPLNAASAELTVGEALKSSKLQKEHTFRDR